MSEVTLDQFKGSNIEKGFQTDISERKAVSERTIIEKTANNFNKGLFGEDLLEKAVSDINSLGMTELSKGSTIDITGGQLLKGETAWIIEKSDDDDEDDEDVEKAKISLEVKKGDDDDDDEDGEDKKEGFKKFVKKGDDTEDVADGGDSKDPAKVGVDDEDEK